METAMQRIVAWVLGVALVLIVIAVIYQELSTAEGGMMARFLEGLFNLRP